MRGKLGVLWWVRERILEQKEDVVDGRAERLKAKLDQLLKEAAEVSVALDRADGTIQGVPHYSVIEARAHELGRQLSCQIQARQMNEVAAARNPVEKCPACGTRCELKPHKRQVTSIDGAVDLQELNGYCPCCRRSFFPTAADAGLGGS